MNITIDYACLLCGLGDNIPYHQEYGGAFLAESSRIVVQANGGIYIGEHGGES